MNIERQLEGNQNRRMANESRFIDRINAREEDAENQIGELVREGKTVYYVFPQGGRYREGTKRELINFLIRNRYA